LLAGQIPKNSPIPTDTIACGIYLLDAERHLTIAGTYGLPPDFVRTMDHAFRQSGTAMPQMEVIESGTLAVRQGAISRFLSNPPPGPVWNAVLEMLHGVSWDTIVSVPLIQEGRVVGVLSYKGGQTMGGDQDDVVVAQEDAEAVDAEGVAVSEAESELVEPPAEEAEAEGGEPEATPDTSGSEAEDVAADADGDQVEANQEPEPEATADAAPEKAED